MEQDLSIRAHDALAVVSTTIICAAKFLVSARPAVWPQTRRRIARIPALIITGSGALT
jgi:hypothetical protein